MSKISFHKVTGSPVAPYAPNTLYFLKSGTGFDLLLTDSAGGAIYGLNKPGTSTSTASLESADLKAIAALTGTSGLLRKTAAGTWSLDTSAYLTGINSGMVTTALGFTPYSAANPSGFITSSGSITGNAATATNQSGGTVKATTGEFSGAVSANAGIGGSVRRGSYGSMSLNGSLNGYSGLDLFDQSTTWMTSISGGVSFGVYKNNASWAFYFNGNGVLSVGTVPGASVSGAVASANHAVNSSKLYSTDKTYSFGSSSPYFGYLTYTGTRWRFQVSPATPSAVEVAYADAAGNAGTVGGLAVHAGRNNEANKVVRTDANGYANFGWINTESGDNGRGGIARIYASGDSYIRYYTPVNFLAALNFSTFSREVNGGTLVPGTRYSIYTGDGAKTMSMPAYADTNNGDKIEIANLHQTWAGAAFTITCPASNVKINMLTENLVCNHNAGGFTLECVWKDATAAFWTVRT